ncbi:MAG: CDP-alcohol phosphatidyltransferase family protein [Candidatus Saccharibacteria bacterium]
METATPAQSKAALSELLERSGELRDMITIPNAISLSGLALVIHGSQRIDTLEGVNEIAIGRGFDLLDGPVARSLHQDSDTGALIDAACDKIGMLYMTSQAWKKGVVPKQVLSTIITSNLLNAGLTVAATKRHGQEKGSYRPTRSGKYAMAAYNAALIFHAYASAFENEYPKRHFHEPLRAVCAGSIIFGTTAATAAAMTYFDRAIK